MTGVKFAAIVEKENGKESTTEAAITYENKKKKPDQHKYGKWQTFESRNRTALECVDQRD